MKSYIVLDEITGLGIERNAFLPLSHVYLIGKFDQDVNYRWRGGKWRPGPPGPGLLFQFSINQELETQRKPMA